jgi:hypothetical protein
MNTVAGCASGPLESLSNPTEYVFSSSSDKVRAVLRPVGGPESWGPMAGSYAEEKGSYHFGFFDLYTQRYWKGRIEKKEDVDPSEAGRIGTIQGDFTAQITAIDADHTRVSIHVDNFEQQVGRRYRITPHFHKGPVFEVVKSDTYFEYLFLSKLGGLLGEKNMPPLKGLP